MFQAGGAIRPGNFYIERKADTELLNHLKAGEFCYVLAPRQIGKSSLRVKTSERLKGDGVHCVSVDLLAIGTSEVGANEWFQSIMSIIVDSLTGLDLDCSVSDFWKNNQNLSILLKMEKFLLQIVLKKLLGPVVIFIDEVDSVLSLEDERTKKDFFGFLKRIHRQRGEIADFQRLSFCLFGVTSSSNLTIEVTHNPFSLGKGLSVSDFTKEEVLELKNGLLNITMSHIIFLEEIYSWTSGHPCMTQRICEELCSEKLPDEIIGGEYVTKKIATLVYKSFLKNGRTTDSSLDDTERRFDSIKQSKNKLEMLEIYKILLFKDKIFFNEENFNHIELSLVGLTSVFEDSGNMYLKVRNLIFSLVFDLEWVEEKKLNILNPNFILT